jgi:hypothetical protein
MYGILGPQPSAPTCVTIHLHVDNADETIRRAADSGATIEREARDEFYGERSGTIRDPFGHRWNIGHNIEDVSPPGDAEALHRANSGPVRQAARRRCQGRPTRVLIVGNPHAGAPLFHAGWFA